MSSELTRNDFLKLGGAAAAGAALFPKAALASLERRLAHNPSDELRVAAQEQRKITRLRIAKLFQ